jgi:hypothetical protein
MEANTRLEAPAVTDRILFTICVCSSDLWATVSADDRQRRPGVTPGQADARYRVNAVGFASNVNWPERKLSLGFKYFKEFSNRSTYQGYSVQISGSFGF